jgi:hypothetical protein
LKLELLNIHLATHTEFNYCRSVAPAKGVIYMTESRVNPPTWLEPRQAVTSIRQLVLYQCALTEGYVRWSMAQTALALTATSPVEYLSRQAKLGATLRKQWTDRIAAAISPVVEPTTPPVPSAAEVTASPTTPPVPSAAEVTASPTTPPVPSAAGVTASPATAEPAPAVQPAAAAESALSPGLAAVLPKLRKANTGAKSALLAQPVEPPPVSGSLRPLSITPTLATSDRNHTGTGNGAGAARSASKVAQENLRQKMERARKSSQHKGHGKRVSD